MSTVTDLVKKSGTEKPVRFTAALSDGQNLFAFRYASDDTATSLYYRDIGDASLIVSEPLGHGPNILESGTGELADHCARRQEARRAAVRGRAAAVAGGGLVECRPGQAREPREPGSITPTRKSLTLIMGPRLRGDDKKSQHFLHQEQIKRLAELRADAGHAADFLKSEFHMQRDRCGV